MAFVPILAAAAAAVGTVTSLAALAGGPGKPPVPQRAPVRDDVQQTTDEVARRRGSGADVLLGPVSGEAKTGGPKVLTGE